MTIPSVEWAIKYKLKVTRIDHLYKDFLKTKITELVNKHIIDPIIESMRANHVHRKIYESVVVDKVLVSDAGILIKIKSEYFAESGFDVALAREKGTEDHMIRPKTAKSLSWIQGGKRRFSSGHMVTGLPNLNLIAQGIEKGEYELQQAINKESRKWLQDILK
jgi:hypothetical protein